MDARTRVRACVRMRVRFRSIPLPRNCIVFRDAPSRTRPELSACAPCVQRCSGCAAPSWGVWGCQGRPRGCEEGERESVCVCARALCVQRGQVHACTCALLKPVAGAGAGMGGRRGND